ncbi:MAG: hypothetical protein H0W76_23695 [Pyrinomonadaceae bacterium]|nr:hypothetical protein [Pyrinomonadaceae bacterium]
MINRKPGFSVMTGIVLGCLLIAPLPAQAQWTVYDPTNHVTQIERMIQDAARWLETIDKYRKDIEHYAKMYDKAVEQLTTLKGVLKTVDEQLARHKALATLVADLGSIVRTSFKLYAQLENMVLHRMAALKRIDDRLRNGIFDIEQDKRDFEQYLRSTMGRSSRDSLANRARIAATDKQLAYWLDEMEKLEAQIAKVNEQLKAAEKTLAAEMAKPTSLRVEVSHINDQIVQLQAVLAALNREHAALMEKITERLAKHGARIQDMENFGRQVVAVNDAWRSLTRTRDKIAATLDKLVSGR